MDLRSRTLPGRQAECSDRDDMAHSGREDDEKQSSSPTLLLDDTPDLTVSSQTIRPSESSTYMYQNRDRETTPYVRWPLPTRMPRGEINFERPMEEFMDQERFPGHDESTLRYPYYEEEHIRDPSGPRIGRPRSPVSRMGSESAPRVSSDRDSGATGTLTHHDKLPRPRRQPPPGRDNERTQRGDDKFEYNRLLPPEVRPRGSAAAHRTVMYYDGPGYEYRLPEPNNNEPGPTLPMFSGKHGSNWDAFRVKFELMAKRYGWSPEKQSEQLLFCLKDEAMEFTAELSPEVHGD